MRCGHQAGHGSIEMPEVVAGITGELEITADEVEVIVQSLEVRRSGM